MYLKKGCEEEYAKRHAAIWPELKQMIKDQGVSDYSIFWDKDTNLLVGHDGRHHGGQPRQFAYKHSFGRTFPHGLSKKPEREKHDSGFYPNTFKITNL